MIHSCYMCLWNTKASSISPKPSPKTCHVPWGQIRLFSLYHKQQHRSLQIHMCQCSLNQIAGIRPSQTKRELLCWNKGAGLRDKGVHLLSVLEYLDLIFLGDNIIPVRFIPLISQHYWTPNMHFISCFHLIFNPLFLSFSFFPTPPILYLSFFCLSMRCSGVGVSVILQSEDVAGLQSAASVMSLNRYFLLQYHLQQLIHHGYMMNTTTPQRQRNWVWEQIQKKKNQLMTMNKRKDRRRKIWDVDSQNPKGQCLAD